MDLLALVALEAPAAPATLRLRPPQQTLRSGS
jgi:hypothetical protein